ncbi:hypothetical protein HN51_056705 [Arachis hypogaea]
MSFNNKSLNIRTLIISLSLFLYPSCHQRLPPLTSASHPLLHHRRLLHRALSSCRTPSSPSRTTVAIVPCFRPFIALLHRTTAGTFFLASPSFIALRSHPHIFVLHCVAPSAALHFLLM